MLMSLDFGVVVPLKSRPWIEEVVDGRRDLTSRVCVGCWAALKS
jgi:hypothetical protein